jgi:hypothetical protein
VRFEKHGVFKLQLGHAGPARRASAAGPAHRGCPRLVQRSQSRPGADSPCPLRRVVRVEALRVGGDAMMYRE